MSTITITLSGSAITGLTGTPSKAFTISDADLQSVLNWAAATFALPASPTNAQILIAWLQDFADRTRHSVQNFGITTQVPTPISIA